MIADKLDVRIPVQIGIGMELACDKLIDLFLIGREDEGQAANLGVESRVGINAMGSV